MQLPFLLGAGALLAVFSLIYTDAGAVDTIAGEPLAIDPVAQDPVAAAPEPVADGHYVLVVEGDRSALAITHASRKPDPWAGVPKGLTSAWRLIVRDARDRVLADVPLDVSPFATRPADLGQPVRVQGCIVRDSRIGMLVNVPRFAAAASYALVRPDAAGEPVAIGQVTALQVRDLAGEGR